MPKQSSNQSISPQGRCIQQLVTAGSLLVVFGLSRAPRAITTPPPNQDMVKGWATRSISLPKPKAIPVLSDLSGKVELPTLTARGVVVMDIESGIYLYQKDSQLPLYPASTTKIMTALIALDSYDLNHVITIAEEERTVGNTMNLIRGEELLVKDLLAGLLISSGNDAALALALAYPQTGYSGYVAAMNAKAQQLGLRHTSYRNVSGLESPAHVTSAEDLAKLARIAYKNPVIRQLVGTKEMSITDQSGLFKHRLKNTNQLLGNVEGVVGMKTGWTDNAGECLVSVVDRNGREIVVVVLGSQDRFGESTALIEWTYNHYTWQNPVTESQLLSDSLEMLEDEPPIRRPQNHYLP